MNYSSRFFLYAPLVLFLAIAVGVGVHWWIVADAFAAKLDGANGHEIAPGVTLRFASRRITGFPFTLDTVFRDISFEIATPHGPTTWRSQDFAMHALSYGREQSIFEAAGRQELDWTRDDGTRRALNFAVGSLHASAVEDQTGLARFDLDLVGFGSKALTAKRLQFHIRHNPAKDGFDLVAEADDVRTRCSRLGDHLVAGRLTGAVTAAQAFPRLRAGTQNWSDAVASWRGAHGTVRIDELRATPLGPATEAQLRTRLTGLPADELFSISDLRDALCGEPTGAAAH